MRANLTKIFLDCKGNLTNLSLGGHVKPDGYHAIARYAEIYGLQAATEVADFERANVEAVTKYVTEEKVDCDFVLTRAIDVQLSDSLSDRIKREYKSLVDAGLTTAKETFAIPDKHAERVFWFLFFFHINVLRI